MLPFFLWKSKVVKNIYWGNGQGRGSLTLLVDECKKSKLVLGLKELRFKNPRQVSYKGGLRKEIIWYSLILWFFHSKNWSIFNEIRGRIFENLQNKKFIMARLSKGNHQWCESEYKCNWDISLFSVVIEILFLTQIVGSHPPPRKFSIIGISEQNMKLGSVKDLSFKENYLQR